MLEPQTSDCPICEEPVGNVKNHVRMSSDGDHGPQGQYPDGFDGSAASRAPPMDVLIFEDDGQPAEAGADVGAEDLEVVEFGDDAADASEYECAECGEDLEYHQEPCNCGEQPMWRAPVVES